MTSSLCRPVPALEHAIARAELSRRVALIPLLLLCACLTPRELGDRALKEERYEEALRHYDSEIKAGSRDPELFYNAAQASLHEGDLGGAERYYSRSLRHGGGVKVMRALAELYVNTSNYARAAQVLYQLLRVDPDQQTIYANLGAALLYSGQPIEAESILLIAQQLAPSDPSPYLNLGVLYDRHFASPARAAAFYTCYVTLTPSQASQRQLATTRAEELLMQVAMTTGEAFPLRCGEVFTPGDYIDERERQAQFESIKRRAREEDAALSAPDVASPPERALAFEEPAPLSTPTETLEPDQRVVIIAERVPDSSLALEERIASAYAESQCELVLTLSTSAAPQETLSVASLRRVAACHTTLGAPAQAEMIWRDLLEREASAGDLLALLEMIAPEREDEARALCQAHKALITLSALERRCRPLLSSP